MSKDRRRTTISLCASDDEHIDRVKERLGVSTDIDAIRLSLKIVATADISFKLARPRATRTSA